MGHFSLTYHGRSKNYCHLHFTVEETETPWVKSFAQVTQCTGGAKNPSLSAYDIRAHSMYAASHSLLM